MYAPLLALDTRLELRNQTETYIEPLATFKEIPKGFVLTNIRISLIDEDIAIFRRIGTENRITQASASYAFIANTERNTLVEVKLAFAGPFVFQSKSFQNLLIGHRLPLSKKDIDQIQERIVEEFETVAENQMISDVVKQQFMNLTRYSFEQLT